MGGPVGWPFAFAFALPCLALDPSLPSDSFALSLSHSISFNLSRPTRELTLEEGGSNKEEIIFFLWVPPGFAWVVFFLAYFVWTV